MIPPARPGFLARDRLSRQLTDSTAKLLLVAAPAGWGKTSLLGDWAAAQRDAGTVVAWVSLDEHDDDTVRFWSYVVTALIDASPDLTEAPIHALAASSDGPVARAVPILLNELAAASSRHVLVLDDFHAITEPEIHEGLEFLLSHLPPTCQVAMATRWDPPMPLARMRVRGDLTELRSEDLQFTRAESDAVLASVSTIDVVPPLSGAIWDQTEGWPAGVKLAALHLRHGPPADPPVTDRRHVLDYFTQEVFPSLEPAQRDLLVRAASLELLSGALCDAALQVEGSATVLADLERADLFVVALDREHRWFRCHRLLRDALRELPGAPSDDERRSVMRRAAQWFDEQGRVEDAIQHFMSAESFDDVVDLLVLHHRWFMDRGRAASYHAFGERLPLHVITPELAIYFASAAHVSGRRDRVEHWLDRCAESISDDTSISWWRSPKAAELCFRATIGLPDSEVESIVELCERSLELETAAGTDQHSVARTALGYAYGLAGRFEEATEILADSWAGRGQGPWSTGVDLQVAEYFGAYLHQQGRFDEVDRLLTEALPLADEVEADWGDAAATVVAMLRLLRVRRDYERGDLDAAAAGMGHALHLAEISSRPFHHVMGQIYRADLELGLGRTGTAQQALMQARELTTNEPQAPFVLALLDEAEARIGRTAVKAASSTGQLIEELTDREMSILRMLPGTATQREIGAALFISINTVKAYNKSLYRKLGASSRHEAVDTARRLGLI